ncbi:dephospho-CoA kinase [Paucilactobacillus hokkaidonensis JCM 18461]|uniref:Dephospho-CoA kinase n=2 Tax=Paucilactobacillus hokkaidonensis TaxID=1193095 RepID=A0A0A1GWZ7_9LACO|nr:dephospho-CoA kinase [Paucilactobacillus hokkaidonensis]KRO09235.1 dephospho-CoA kinase [Paucilactobacillus hokkaidonensis]BAP85434.1 dephospho-CoA kinase [Paucilactobacillus hokkaidonensis JCM 18461]
MTTILGLTGGIATGKSTVSAFFKSKDIPVIDADVVARQVVKIDSAGLRQIIAAFGPRFLNVDHSLNRKQLGELVFTHPDKLTELNEIMQPLIANEVQRQISTFKQLKVPLVVLDAPLLFEQHYENVVDLIMVVTTTPAIQLDRLMKRNQLSQKNAEKRISAQWSLIEKEKRADVVIDNSRSIEATNQQVVEWLEINHLV